MQIDTRTDRPGTALGAGMNPRPTSPGFGAVFVLLCLALVALATPTLSAQPDPIALQRQALERLDGYVAYFRKTGDIQSRRGEAVQAAAELEQSNRMLAERGDSPALALGLFKLGRARSALAQFPQAEAAYAQAEQVAGRLGLTARQAEAMAGKASAGSSQHNYGQAFADAGRAVALAKGTKDPDSLANALDALGNVQVAQGDLFGASDTFTRQVEAARGATDRNALYQAYLNRHNVYVKRAEKCDFDLDFASCLDAVKSARADLVATLGIVRSLGYDGLAGMVEGLTADLDDRKKLIELRQSGLATVLSDKSMFQPLEASDVLFSENFVPVRSPNEEPSPLVGLAESIQREMSQRYGAFAEAVDARSLHMQGQMLNMQGQPEPALDAYLKALDAFERDLGTFADERSRASYIEDRREFYDAPALLLLQQRRQAEAFGILERSRSRAIADLLASRTPGIRDPAQQALYAEAATLRARISQAQARLFVAGAPGTADPKTRSDAARAGIAEDEARYQAVLARMQQEAPRLASLVQSKPVGLKALQDSMRAEGYETLYYTATDSGLILWHISPDAVFVRNVFIPRAELASKAIALRTSLRDPTRPFNDTVASELFLYLVQPALTEMHSDRLVVIPPEDLTDIPFQVLRNPAGGRYLGERYRISYAPSATVLLALPQSGPLGKARVVALAKPGLTDAPEEVQAIGALFPGRSQVRWESLPRKDELAGLLDGFGVVHLAVHGKFEPNAPMLSYLQLAPSAGGDDGKLTAAEMFGLPLERARLVTLSACETGRAQSTHANEQLGMSRALLFAGADALLLSQWEIASPTTAAWMRAFYAAALAHPLPEAVQTASLQIKQDPATAHPFYWAPFMLLGR